MEQTNSSVSRVMTEVSRRAFFRINYPLVERPAFEVGRFIYEVVDCSELGLRYEIRDRRVPMLGAQLAGKIVFRRGQEVQVAGEVIRSSGGFVVLQLDAPGVTFHEMLAEQRYLRAKGYTLRE
jgi:hypothetical protein